MAKPKPVVTEYRNYYLPPSFPVFMLTGDHWRLSDVMSPRLHFHNCLEIGVCHSDHGVMKFYGHETPFREGDVTVVPRNVPHTTCSAKGTASLWSYMMIDPKALFSGLLPATWKNYDLLSYGFSNFRYMLNREYYPNVYQKAMMIIEEMKAARPGYQLVIKGLLFSLYVEIYRIESNETPDSLETNSSAPPSPSGIMPALDYIENNYMQQFSIEDLADMCHWSPTHFRRVFHEMMGISPLDYLINTRVMKSCSLLCNSSQSILEISGMVGFQSVSSYNRHFSEIMQESPREYRKRSAEENEFAENLSVLQYSGWMYPEKLSPGQENANTGKKPAGQD